MAVAFGLLETLPVQRIVIHSKRRNDAARDRSTVLEPALF
jgi:hypothetical protein